MPVSEAQKRAKAKYQSKARTVVTIETSKADAEQWKQAAAACGSSLSGFIKDATRARIASLIADGVQIETPDQIADRIAAEKAETEKQPDRIDADTIRHKYVTD